MLCYCAFLNYAKSYTQNQKGTMRFRLPCRQEVSQNCLPNSYCSKLQSSNRISKNERHYPCIEQSGQNSLCDLYKEWSFKASLLHYISSTNPSIFHSLYHHKHSYQWRSTIWCSFGTSWFFQLLIDNKMKSLLVRCKQMI